MTSTSAGRIVVGVLYPPKWYRDQAAFAAALDAICALDDRIDVVVETYVEDPARRIGPDARHAATDLPPPPEISAAMRDAFAQLDIAVAIDLPDDLAELAPRLEWVQAVGAGVNHLERTVARSGARLTSNGGSNAIGIAEFVFGRVLEHWKDFAVLADSQQAHRWYPHFGRQLSGCTLGLLGFGAINQAVARRAAAFGMRTVVMRRNPSLATEGVDEVVGEDGLAGLLGASDVVVAALPETARTTGMMGREQFAAMKPGAFFCNVGRGSLVDELALRDALVSGHLGGAAIDVAVAEPLPSDDPLWDAPNLRISAHCSTVPAAMFPTLHRTFLDNLRRYLAGEPLLNEVLVEQ
jgi:phosphoglycerate dehydrogenase-like enzyme